MKTTYGHWTNSFQHAEIKANIHQREKNEISSGGMLIPDIFSRTRMTF